MPSDDEIMRRLQARADSERPETIEFNGPGPFELPKCSHQVSALTIPKEEYFVLQLETEERDQRLLIPVSVRALPSLKALVDHLVKNIGLGQPRN
jgi:hypothetical protein